MKKYFLFLFLLFSVLHFSQSNVKLPFVGIRSFSFCGGNACESYIEITKNGMCRIESYGFDGTVIKAVSYTHLDVYKRQELNYQLQLLKRKNRNYHLGLKV